MPPYCRDAASAGPDAAGWAYRTRVVAAVPGWLLCRLPWMAREADPTFRGPVRNCRSTDASGCRLAPDLVAQIDPGHDARHEIGDHAERVGGRVVAVGVDPEAHVDGEHGGLRARHHEGNRQHREHGHEGEDEPDEERLCDLREHELDEHAQAR